MLANTRSWLLLFLVLAFSLVTSSPVAAQVLGLAPSVTSPGFGGHDTLPRGIPPSVTSLGPSRFSQEGPLWANCCGNFFLPSGDWQFGPRPPLRVGRHRHHRDDLTYLPVAVPAYLPYAVPYAADPDDEVADATDDSDAYAYAANLGPAKHAAVVKSPPHRVLDKNSGTGDETTLRSAAPERTEESVDPQPATVLVYKDGHRSDIVNYAIVGDTLFDFGEGRTHKTLLADLDIPATQKANDASGVEFKLPPAGEASSAMPRAR